MSSICLTHKSGLILLKSSYDLLDRKKKSLRSFKTNQKRKNHYKTKNTKRYDLNNNNSQYISHSAAEEEKAEEQKKKKKKENQMEL